MWLISDLAGRQIWKKQKKKNQADHALSLALHDRLCAPSLPLLAPEQPPWTQFQLMMIIIKIRIIIIMMILVMSQRVDGEPLYLITASPVEEVQRLALCDPLEREPPEEGPLLQSSTLLQFRITVVTEVSVAKLLLVTFPFRCSIGDFLPQSPNVNHRMGLDMISKRGVWVNLVLCQLSLQIFCSNEY